MEKNFRFDYTQLCLNDFQVNYNAGDDHLNVCNKYKNEYL